VPFVSQQPSGFGKGARVTGLAISGLWLFVRIVPRWLFPAALPVAVIVGVWALHCSTDAQSDGVCGPVRPVRDGLALARSRLDAALSPR
jgi:hypothetical protein